MFNEGDYWEKTRAGILRAEVKKSRHPALPLADEPYCTESQMVLYIDDQGVEVALVHQYLRPDHTIGGSHKPDPKRLVKDDKLYKLTKSSDKTSQEEGSA